MTDVTDSGCMPLLPHEQHLRAVPALSEELQPVDASAYARGYEDCRREAVDAMERQPSGSYELVLGFVLGAVSSLLALAIVVGVLRAVA